MTVKERKQKNEYITFNNRRKMSINTVRPNALYKFDYYYYYY